MSLKKNPVSLLQEISVRRRYIMRDTLLKEHGEGHEKKFEILLVLDGSPGSLTGTATASSKSEAKKLAAVDILKKVIKLDELKLKDNEREEIVNVLLSEDNSREPECPADYIAVLERTVTLKGLPTPIFDLVNQGGPPHQRMFVYKCKIGDKFDTIGAAGQKKAAKRVAAEKMLKIIEDASEKFPRVTDKCTIDADVSTNELLNASLSLCKSPTSSKGANESGPENIEDVKTREVQSPKSVSKVADNGLNNPISQLEREVLRIGLPKPEYRLSVAEGPSLEMMLTMKCEIGEIFSTLGCAIRKKDAKRIAAQAMLDELKSSRSLFHSGNGADSMSVCLQLDKTVSSMMNPCTKDELVSKVEQMEISCEETGNHFPSSEANTIAVGSSNYMNKLKELEDKFSELAESCK